MKQQNLVRGDSQPINSNMYKISIFFAIHNTSSCLLLTIIHLYYQISFLQKGINEDIQ